MIKRLIMASLMGLIISICCPTTSQAQVSYSWTALPSPPAGSLYAGTLTWSPQNPQFLETNTWTLTNTSPVSGPNLTSFSWTLASPYDWASAVASTGTVVTPVPLTPNVTLLINAFSLAPGASLTFTVDARQSLSNPLVPIDPGAVNSVLGLGFSGVPDFFSSPALGSGDWNVDSRHAITGAAVAVPEPAAWLLCGFTAIGGAGYVWLKRKRQLWLAAH